jgi:argininosuccinate lyase
MSPGDQDGSVVRRDRFSGGPARSFLSSMAADRRIFAADLAVDRAHLAMLTEQGIVDGDEAAAIFAALDSVEDAGFEALPDGEDVHEAIETAVIEAVGPVGGKLHTARSRNDEVATCIRYRLREDLLAALEAAVAFREALVEVATAHTETVMPGYTHLQPAQPTTLAHYLLSYEQQAARDTARLLAAYDRTNQSPLGGAAFAGTPFDIDRARTADLLGFDGVLENSMDAVTTRDFLLETAGALAGLSVTLSGLAEDLIVFANKGLVELDDDYASTSSIMPQKKNPDSLELVRATAGDAAAAFQGLHTTLSGLPRAYNRDLQKATPHVWEAIDEVTEATSVAAGAVATAEWDKAALAAAAGEGFSTATGVADRLAMAGLPFRTAHEIVAEAAGNLDSDGGPTDQAEALAAVEAATQAVTGDALSSLVEIETIAEILDPVESVAARDSAGGPAPSATAAVLETAEEGIDADTGAIDERREAIEAAATALAEVVGDHA